MRAKHCAKLVDEGEYVAEVDVELVYSDEGWSPYLSLGDAVEIVRQGLDTDVAAGNSAAVRDLARDVLLKRAKD